MIAASPVATRTNKDSQDHIINVTRCKNMAAFGKSTLYLSLSSISYRLDIRT